MDPWELFNRKLDAFVSDVRPLIGHLPEYSAAQSSVRMLANIDPRKNQEVFNRAIATKYEAQILAKDETFFLSASDLTSAKHSGIVALVRDIWGEQLAESDKGAIWAHLHVLVALNRRCVLARANALGSGGSASATNGGGMRASAQA